MNHRHPGPDRLLLLLLFLAVAGVVACSGPVRAETLVPPEARISDDQARTALAQTLARLGRVLEAVRLIRDQLDRSPGNWRLSVELADLELGRGHAKQARELFLRALELTDRPEEVRPALAGAMTIWGDFHGAGKIYRNRLAAHPDETQTNLKLAGILTASQRYAEAEGIFLDLLLENRAETEARLGLAEIRFFEKDFQAALAHANRGGPAPGTGSQGGGS